MTLVAEFSFKDMGFWFQGGLSPFFVQFQLGPLTMSIGGENVAAKTAFWTAAAIRMAWDWADSENKLSEEEADAMFERLTEAVNASTTSIDEALDNYKRLFPHLTEEQILKDFRVDIEGDEKAECY